MDLGEKTAVKTDVCIYIPIDGPKLENLIKMKEECQVCLMKFVSKFDSKFQDVVQSNIDTNLKGQPSGDASHNQTKLSMKSANTSTNLSQALIDDLSDSSLSSDSSTDPQELSISRRAYSYYHLACFQAYFTQSDIIRSLDRSEELRQQTKASNEPINTIT